MNLNAISFLKKEKLTPVISKTIGIPFRLATLIDFSIVSTIAPFKSSKLINRQSHLEVTSGASSVELATIGLPL